MAYPILMNLIYFFKTEFAVFSVSLGFVIVLCRTYSLENIVAPPIKISDA